ncbi:DciA family protein [Thermaerobacter subterraneus]|uniref:RNA-binding protein containing Zn ribbon n=1 Tax=Thermaerobacter subterraneus DSM 13965 TaxID=867903 RepID=K6QDI9_9FIRM|nr:DciA family protein [Thermaerobacter subterraneus]EKP94761.1 Protein of unknown function (DUF721) [Thermaerobacter subterraneus DSM 13965]
MAGMRRQPANRDAGAMAGRTGREATEGRSGGPAQALGPVLEGLLTRLGLATRARRFRILQEWARVVGPVIAARARPYRLTGDVLWVAVQHPGWAQELSFLKGKIVADLNAAAGVPVIRDIRFTAGPRGPRREAPSGAPSAAVSRVLPGGCASPGDGRVPAAPSGRELAGEPGGTDNRLPWPADPALQEAATRWLGAARWRRRWALERGWRPCGSCGSLFPPGPEAGGTAGAGLCPACRAAREERLRQQVRALLERDPWLTCPQVAQALGVGPEVVARLYREERAALQDRWRARLRVLAAGLRRGEPPPPETRSLLLRYVLLRTGREPGALTAEEALAALGVRLAPLWEACFSGSLPGARTGPAGGNRRPLGRQPGGPDGGRAGPVVPPGQGRPARSRPGSRPRRPGAVGEGPGEGT